MDIRLLNELTQTDLKRYNRQLAAYHKLRLLAEQARAEQPRNGQGKGHRLNRRPRPSAQPWSLACATI
jgi:hypothetical protein